MKKLFFLALPFLLLGCGEDSSSDTVLPPSAPASVITVTPASYDFGTVNAGETKTTAHFTINTDGFVTSRYGVDVVDMLGLNADDAENTLKTMYQNQTTTGLFSLSFTPICKGNINGELYIVTDRYGGASITIPITAFVTDDTNTLPKCSSESPVITVTSLPENMIKTGEIAGQGTQKYIDFNTSGTNKITITAVSDTYLSGGSSSTSTGGTFNSKVTFWELKDNKVSATAEITFNPDSCSGPASDRIAVNGLDGPNKYSYLYIIGTGTAVNGTECINRYPLQTN